MLQRVRAFFEKILGNRYAAAVSTLDRAVAAFGIMFATKLLGGDVFDIRQLTHLSYWATAATAAIAAAVSVVKSVLAIQVTGTPALLSLVSSTLRHRRAMGHRPEHKIPIRPAKKKPAAPVRRRRVGQDAPRTRV